MNRLSIFLVLFAILPFAFAAQCALSAFPDTLQAGKTSVISLTYTGRTENTNAAIINCGDGRSVASFNCPTQSGGCSASCYYPTEGYYTATATIDSFSCNPASVTVTKASAFCGDGICDADIGESSQTCPADCGALRYCGDGICDYAESPATCPADCGSAPTTCSDGTRLLTCSASRPYYCSSAGMLINHSSVCGCPSGYVAKDEYCIEQPCSDGTPKNACSLSKPLYCNASSQLEEKSSVCGCPAGTTASANACLAPGSCGLFSAYAITNSLNVSAGTDAKYSIFISNPSSASQVISLSTTMTAGLYGEFSKSFITLPAGSTTYSDLVLHTGSTTDGTYQLNITAGAANCNKQFPVNITVYSNGSGTGSCCSADQSLSASIYDSKDQLFRPGDTAEYSVYMINEGNAKVIVSLSTPTSVFDSSFSKNQFDIKAGESDTVKVRFKIPAGTPGTSFAIPIIIRYTNACCIREFPIPVSFSVYGPRVMASLIGEPAPDCQTVYSGSQPTTLKLGMRNDGDATTDFKLGIGEKTPLYGNVDVSQTSIQLKQGETGFFNIYVSPYGLEEGKTYSYSFSASSGPFTILNRNYCFTVKPQSGAIPAIHNTTQVILQIPEISVVDGIGANYDVMLTNPTESTFYNLSLYLEGVPYDWYAFTGDKATISPFSTKVYSFSFTGRTYQEQSSFRKVSAMIMSNGYTIGRANATVEVDRQNRSIDFSYVVTPTVTSGETISALEVQINVVNNGNMPENLITPQIDEGTSSSLNYTATPSYLNLSPGESGMFTVTFWPSSDKVASQNVPIKVGSGTAETTKTVTIPAMTGLAVLAHPIPTWLMAVLLILAVVAIMVILSRYNEPVGMGKK